MKWIILLFLSVFTLISNAQLYQSQYLGLSYDDIVAKYLKSNSQWFSSNRKVGDTLVITLHQTENRDKNIFYIVDSKCIKHIEVCIEISEVIHGGIVYNNKYVCGINTEYVDGDDIVTIVIDKQSLRNMNGGIVTRVKNLSIKNKYYNFYNE